MRKPTAFVTGIAGFAGSFLAEELLDCGYRVYGGIYPGESPENLESVINHVTLVKLDIMDAGNCRTAISALKPHFIFHLAALASVGQSFEKERLTFRVNFEGTLNILQAIKAVSNLKQMIFVSSSDCYGFFRPKNKTLTEKQPLNPITPYGISKAAAEQASLFYFRQYNLPVTVARSFNHSGPRQNENFVIPAFSKQIAAIEAGYRKPVLLVGDLSVRRDLSDVRDIVHGYRLLAEKGRSGRVYHFCSGKAVSIQRILDRLLRFSSKKIKVKVDQSRLRKSDIPILRGDNRRAVQELGYKPRYSLQATLKDTLDYWRDKLLKTPIAR
jgi:GDP-4-dehydro-6-deoxy-D-mannose reductase